MLDDGQRISRSGPAVAAMARSEARRGLLSNSVQRSFVPRRTARSMRLRWVSWVLFLLSLAAVGIWPGAILVDYRNGGEVTSILGARQDGNDAGRCSCQFLQSDQGGEMILSRLRRMAWRDWTVPIQPRCPTMGPRAVPGPMPPGTASAECCAEAR